jgi:acetolactate synthase-1/2/3 large subunit
VNPDFALLARAYGLSGETVERTENFPAAFARACASDGAALLELRIDPEAITPRTTLSALREKALAARESAEP